MTGTERHHWYTLLGVLALSDNESRDVVHCAAMWQARYAIDRLGDKAILVNDEHHLRWRRHYRHLADHQ